MNFVGHIHIGHRYLVRYGLDGRRASGEPLDRYLLGTALPDFATIGRFQLTGEPADSSVAAGVDMHHATDNAFHACDWFVTNSQAVRADLERRGVNRGAARAVGHVGVELLLDGHLLASAEGLRDQAQRVLGLADDEQLELRALVAEDRRHDWYRHLARISSWPLPDDYHEPTAVAERLNRILRPRRRLAFDPHHIVVVADTLADHAPNLIAGIAAMVDSLAEDLAESPA